jgi:hypothetical protein
MSLIKNKSYFLYDVPEHQKHKPEIINLIKQIPQNCCGQISHTDYNLPNSLNRVWYQYFLKNIFFPWRDKFCDVAGSEINLHNCWFQWYEKNDFHSWHVHESAHFTNIYYLDLPNKEIKTQIKEFNEDKTIEVSEGQILTIPAFWKHKSPPNIFDQPKIVISFNLELKS